MSRAAACAPRVETLDIIRGVAVMGIFSVNVISFAMPFAAYFNPAAYGGTTGANLLIWAVNFVLIDGKMRGLFTLLFGASMLLVIQRAEATGRSPAAVHYSRMIWLLFLGLFHFYLIWFGDILTLYASVGMIAYLFRNRSVRALILWGMAFLLLDLATMGGVAYYIAGAEAAAHAPGASAQAIEAGREAASGLVALEPAALARTLADHRAGYAAMVQSRLTDGLLDPALQFIFGSAEALGSMLLGMAAFKSGFLSGAWADSRYRRIASGGLTIGIAGYAALAWRTWDAGFPPSITFANFFVLSVPFRLAMMFGYAALIIIFARRGGWLVRRLAAAGRAAFSNYLGTGIVAGAIFYGYGLGLYGYLSRFEAWLAVPAMWALILLWSKPWLDRFNYGPFEWLWRSLARWRLQPLRKPGLARTTV